MGAVVRGACYVALALVIVVLMYGGAAFLAAELFGVHVSQPGLGEVMIFLIGGIVAAVLALWLFEGALILLSSLVGAALIADALDLTSSTRSLALIGLTVLGIAVQAGITARRSRRAPVRERRP